MKNKHAGMVRKTFKKSENFQGELYIVVHRVIASIYSRGRDKKIIDLRLAWASL